MFKYVYFNWVPKCICVLLKKFYDKDFNFCRIKEPLISNRNENIEQKIIN